MKKSILISSLFVTAWSSPIPQEPPTEDENDVAGERSIWCAILWGGCIGSMVLGYGPI